MNKKLIFIVYGFDFTNQYGGVIALHKLADILSELGEASYIYAKKTYPNNKAALINDNEVNNIKNKENVVAIYPEVVVGNPLGIKNVIRWILYTPGANGGQKIYNSEEIVYQYSKYFTIGTPYENVERLYCIEPNHSIYYDKKMQRSGTCILIKKGRSKVGEYNYAGDVIDHIANSPNIHSILPDILNKYEKLISYDSASYISVLAALSGCVSIVVPDQNVSKEEWISKQEIVNVGVAYGLDDISRAIETQHLVRKNVEDFHLNGIKSVKNFRDRCYEKIYINIEKQK